MKDQVRELIQLAVKLVERGERNRDAIKALAGVCEAVGFRSLAVELRELETINEAGEASAWIVAAMFRVGELIK